MFLPDLNNHENYKKNQIAQKFLVTILRKLIDLICDYWHIDQMRSIRECRHCGREFYSMKDEFCSFDCVTQVSS